MRPLRGFAAAAHPFPLAMVMALTALIGLASTGGSPDARALGLALIAMFASQLAIGWSNDYLDREADALHQPWKPVPSGMVEAGLLPPAIGLALAVSAAAGVLLGVLPLLLLVAGTGCGLAYNLGLKRTRFSAAAFIVAFAVLPPFVWTALDAFQGEFLALYGVGLTLPVAAHVANVLPDMETDRAQGRRTVAVALGRGKSVRVTLSCLLVPLPLTALSLAWLDYDGSVLIPTLIAYGGLSIAAGALYARTSAREADIWAFRCVVVAAVLFASGWLAALEVP